MDQYSPVRIMSDVAAINAGGNHNTATKKDGSLWAWGNNECGQLGDGTTIDRYSPVKVMDDVKLLAAATTPPQKPVMQPPATATFPDVPTSHWAYASITKTYVDFS
jgi:hypothetical protein